MHVPLSSTCDMGSHNRDDVPQNVVQQNGAQQNGAQQNGAQQNGAQPNGAQPNGVQQNGVQLHGDAVRQRVVEAAAVFGTMADAVDAAAADVLGVNRTDLTILGAVHRAGRSTAGEAATAASLSAPATTAAIQRLVAAGLLAREVDPTDRRRAVLTLTSLARERIEQVYGPIGAEVFGGHLNGYSPEDLAVIERFLTDGIAVQQHHARRIRSI